MSDSRLYDLWGQFKDNCADPHFASTDTLLDPKRVDEQLCGKHASIVVVKGTRVYLFEGQKNRDRFVNAYRAWEAKPCKDPLP